MTPMPTKLEFEPIVEAVCEIQFTASAPAAQVLPGLLFSLLDGEKEVKKLATGMLPPEVIAANQSLKYQPTTSLIWKRYEIRFSDHSIQIVCSHPYPGWSDFKEVIGDVFSRSVKSNIILEITRYSLKYVDFIPADSVESRAEKIAMGLSVGRDVQVPSNFQVHVEIGSDVASTLLTVACPAAARNVVENTEVAGILITTDSIVQADKLPSQQDIMGDFQRCIDILHHENKFMFFNSLSEKGIESLGAVYD